jgi:hypothetical protein
MLTTNRIEELAARPEVQAVAVENFLASLDGLTYQEAVANCEQDARSYRWNHATSGTIREGLVEHFFPRS